MGHPGINGRQFRSFAMIWILLNVPSIKIKQMLLITGKKYTSVPARAILPPQKRVGVFNIVEWSVCHPGTHFSSSSICRFTPHPSSSHPHGPRQRSTDESAPYRFRTMLLTACQRNVLFDFRRSKWSFICGIKLETFSANWLLLKKEKKNISDFKKTMILRVWLMFPSNKTHRFHFRCLGCYCIYQR